MPGLAGIRQSVERALRLLQETGFMDSGREAATAAWVQNVREARRELREVADELTGPMGDRLYLQMSAAVRQHLWRAVLRSTDTNAPGNERYEWESGTRIMLALRSSACPPPTTLPGRW